MSNRPLDFDFENEAIMLAEKAARWRSDWVDYATVAEERLRAAYEAGRKESANAAK